MSAFRPTSMVITAKKCSMLTAEGGGKTITRNSSYFKKLHSDFGLQNKETTQSYLEDNDSEDEDPDNDHHFMPEEERCSRSKSCDYHSPGTAHTQQNEDDAIRERTCANKYPQKASVRRERKPYSQQTSNVSSALQQTRCGRVTKPPERQRY